jgi:DNA polymerase-4
VRTIIHVDMDAFYASVEQRDNPQLQGAPVVVGGVGPRAVVAAASYQARRFGVFSAMPMSRARKLCPQLHIVRPRMSNYQDESKTLFSVFREFTPDIEGLSLDEAFLDVTASLTLFGTAIQIAHAIKARVHELTKLKCSVGIGPNKLVAKIASDLDKPDGLVEVLPDEIHATLDPLPLSVLPGLGPKQRQPLTAGGLRTVGDLRRATPQQLDPLIGPRATHRLQRLAAGQDNRAVSSRRADKSLSAETTFDTDLSERRDLYRELSKLADKVASRTRTKGLTAKTLTIKLRTPDFKTVTRQRSMPKPTASTQTFSDLARELLDEWLREHPKARLRLLGVAAAGLQSDPGPDLFETADADAPMDELDAAGDRIRNRFGATALGRARQLSGSRPPDRRGSG